MHDDDCVRFLKAHLPRLGLRWAGYRKVRGTVRKRLRRRLRHLGLADLEAYHERLERDPAEWAELDAMCRIPISRFHRDPAVFEALAGRVLPELAARAEREGRRRLRAWSCGAASGEEPYTLTILWRLAPGLRDGGVDIEVVATDNDEGMLARAARGCYQPGSLEELPAAYRERAFSHRDDLLCIEPAFRAGISLRHQDVRAAMPDGPFDLVLCRNLVFTYFVRDLQASILERLVRRLKLRGYLVIGRDETLPSPVPGLAPFGADLPIFRRVEARSQSSA